MKARKKIDDSILTQAIIDIVKARRPNDVQELVNLLKKETGLSEAKVIEHLIKAQNQGKITLTLVPTKSTQKLSSYLKMEKSYWYWITLILTVTAATTVLVIPNNATPIIYIKYVLGGLFVIWFPGYSLIKALFPAQPSSKKSLRNMDSVERIALSVAMSLALVAIVGLLLTYTPWGIGLAPIVTSLFTITPVFATVAVLREYQSQLRRD